MAEAVNQEIKGHPLVDEYLEQIPVGLRDLMAPARELLAEFAVAVKSLRLKEEERAYVMAIQQRYRLPLRPNETVKRTMIRARLAILRKRQEAEAEGDIVDTDWGLPVDPLE
jgi:hypothetical protein